MGEEEFFLFFTLAPLSGASPRNSEARHMKKIISLPILFIILGLISNFSVFAQAEQEEAQGKIILEKLESKELNCQNLTDQDFEVVGEYFMGRMTGNSHEAMNQMMENMMGKQGEENMHIIMGKRMSGCDTNVQFPQNTMNSMQMMGNLSGFKGVNSMMNFGFWTGFGWPGWIMMILVWVWVILGVLGIVVLIKWIIKK